MKLISKFDVGDTVWVVSNNVVCKLKVDGVYIDASVDTSEINVSYVLRSDLRFNEEDVYATKEELLENL